MGNFGIILNILLNSDWATLACENSKFESAK